MTASNSVARKAASKFVVQSHEERGRHYMLCFCLATIIILALCWIDPGVKNDPLWIVGGLLIGLVLIETAPVKRHVELCVEVGPLGIQRTTKVNQRMTHHPLLPRACVQDCIITEHIQTFGVASHLVFRMMMMESNNTSLVPVFPNVRLPFSQCQSMLEQIQRAMREQ